METSKKNLSAEQAGKQFDAVNMMREIRDEISAETKNMTFEELKEYIKKQLADNKSKLIGQ
jgi:tripartite-type tricarboxylate transporter receptor subunit TctC